MPTATRDNLLISITAHIKTPSELRGAGRPGADGIGLLEAHCPAGLSQEGAEEYYYAFLREAGEVPGRLPVTVLLPDLGGEGKSPPPGIYGIRLFLSGPDRYRPFLRALLRAGADGCYELALPMVGQLSEVMAFKAIMGDVRAGLEEEGTGYATPVAGVLVEVPSVIPAIKAFMFESGFFMVGENYLKNLLADQSVAEGEEGLTAYYSQAFLLQAMFLAESLKGRKEGVRICAPVVRDPVAVPILLGLGFNHIVAPPDCIAEVKKGVQSINLSDAKMVASKATSYWDPVQAREYAGERIARLMP